MGARSEGLVLAGNPRGCDRDCVPRPAACDIYTFAGLEVEEGNGSPVDWLDADGWTGMLGSGLVAAGATCGDWTVSTGNGRNTELDARQMFRQESRLCSDTLAVMCVRISE